MTIATPLGFNRPVAAAERPGRHVWLIVEDLVGVAQVVAHNAPCRSEISTEQLITVQHRLAVPPGKLGHFRAGLMAEHDQLDRIGVAGQIVQRTTLRRDCLDVEVRISRRYLDNERSRLAFACRVPSVHARPSRMVREVSSPRGQHPQRRVHIRASSSARSRAVVPSGESSNSVTTEPGSRVCCAVSGGRWRRGIERVPEVR